MEQGNKRSINGRQSQGKFLQDLRSFFAGKPLAYIQRFRINFLPGYILVRSFIAWRQCYQFLSSP